MKSFDLFRTLCFARNGQPGEDTVENHFPIEENIVKVAPKPDIVVSEYHAYSKARAILTHIGLESTKLVVTETGKTDGTIWPALAAEGIKPTEHMGDNYQQDVVGPEKHGIKGVLVTQHEPTPLERACGELGNVMREERP